ncbi:MAG: VOC family protein [Halioglobus sp.]
MTLSDFETLPRLPGEFGPAEQVAYIVRDIDAAIQFWQETFDVGPFLVARNELPLSNAYYRGQKAEKARVNIAFAYVGDMQLELIELIGDTPSLYKEALDREHSGVHHYAVFVDDFPRAYNWALDNGFDAVVDAGVDGLARMSYIENPDTGLILEVIEYNGLTRPYFDVIERRVSDVAPGQPVQEFELAELTPRFAVYTALAKLLLKKMTGQVKQTRRVTETAA